MKANPLGAIFLSYSHADANFVMKLDLSLRGLGYQTWLDEKDLVPGDSIVEDVSRALSAAKAVITVISSASIDRPWLRYELSSAVSRMISGRCRVIPALIDGARVPVMIEQLLYADFRKGWDAGFSQVQAALQKESDLIRKSRAPSLDADDWFERMQAVRQIVSEELGPHRYYDWEVDDVHTIEYEGFEIRASDGTVRLVSHELAKSSKKSLTSDYLVSFKNLIARVFENYGIVITQRPIGSSLLESLFKFPVRHVYYSISGEKSELILIGILDVSTDVESESDIRLRLKHFDSLVQRTARDARQDKRSEV